MLGDSPTPLQGAGAVHGNRLRWRQFTGLTWKNWIVLTRHWLINLLRCLIVPVAYYAFLVETQSFLYTSNDLGLGTAVPIRALAESFALRGGPFYWIDSTGNSTSLSPQAIIDRFTEQLDADQRSRVQRIESAEALAYACPQTFVGLSPCFGAVQFNSLNAAQGDVRVNYTLRFDPGLLTVRVSTHSSDVEKYHLPVQLALDRSIVSLARNIPFSQAATTLNPLEQPFTRSTNAEQNESKRISLLRGINELVVLAYLIGFLGVPYHLASDVSSERGAGMAGLLTSLGCWQPARLLAWMAGPVASYLPAYLIMSGIIAGRLWTQTSPAITIFALLLQGLALGSFTLFLAMFFRRSNLSAIIATALTLLLGVAALLSYTNGGIGQAGMIVLGLLFPPMNFVYLFISVGLFEISMRGANLVQRPPAYAPDAGQPAAPPAAASPLALMVMSAVSVVLFFLLALLVERYKFYPDPWRRTKRHEPASSKAAVSLRGLTKQYSKKKDSLAVDNLSFDVQEGSLTYLLGGNGSGKSTTIGMLSGTIARTAGEVRIFGTDRSSLPPGVIGLCPQKDVLFVELTTTQHVRLFSQLKGSAESSRRGKIAEAHELLDQCDLAEKRRARPAELSGGQRRKLCLACSLAGHSRLILCDEATSGLDPLSRRAIWKILLAQRYHRTVIATSHFLDEADFLGDDVKIMASPGRLLAQGTPVALRRDLGDGASIHVQAATAEAAERTRSELLAAFPSLHIAEDAGNRDASAFTLAEPDSDADLLVKVLDRVEQARLSGAVTRYDCVPATMESVFLKLNVAHEREIGRDDGVTAAFAEEKPALADPAGLSDGRPRSFISLACVQFLKRMHILRRSWIGPLLALLLSILGSIAALVFLRNRDASCIRGFTDSETDGTTSLGGFGQVLVAPAALASAITAAAPSVNASLFLGVTADNFTATFSPGGPWQDISIGGILDNAQPTFAWVADTTGPIVPIALLSLINNVVLAQEGVSVQITPAFQPLSELSLSSGFGTALRWAIVFALVQAVWPAFAALYPSNERRSGAKQMLLTNGQRPLPLWLGHLLAELPVIVIATVPVIAVYAAFDGGAQFVGLGYFWLCMFLAGIAGTLQAFLISHFTPNPLAAFAVAAAWSVLAQLIYIAAVLSILTFVVSSNILSIILTANYAIAILSPSVSLTRASWVSGNLFNLICDGRGSFSDAPFRSLGKFGAPILYLVLWILAAGAATVLVDEAISWSSLFRRKLPALDSEATIERVGDGVAEEAARANDPANSDILKVQHLTHAYGSLVAVDDVSFSMPAEETFALCGPNGAGKSTTHACIRGEIRPRAGHILVDGVDNRSQRRLARAKLSSVPQHDGLDDTLTVREHLLTYARVKGLPRRELRRNIDVAIALTDLAKYRDRQAGALSGGNRRKLSLALALMGNPAIYMLDELGSGVDAVTKRVLWKTLRKVGHGRAILMTTHSMEEVDALADRLAIQAGRFLAVGTVDELRRARPFYEVQLSTRPLDGVSRAEQDERVRAFVLQNLPSARVGDSASARFEVPTGDSAATSVSHIYARLQGDAAGRAHAGIDGFVAQPISLEGLFLHIVKEAKHLSVA